MEAVVSNEQTGSGGVAEPRNNVAMIYAGADGSRRDGTRNVNIDVRRQAETQQQSIQPLAGGSQDARYNVSHTTHLNLHITIYYLN